VNTLKVVVGSFGRERAAAANIKTQILAKQGNIIFLAGIQKNKSKSI